MVWGVKSAFGGLLGTLTAGLSGGNGSGEPQLCTLVPLEGEMWSPSPGCTRWEVFLPTQLPQGWFSCLTWVTASLKLDPTRAQFNPISSCL